MCGSLVEYVGNSAEPNGFGSSDSAEQVMSASEQRVCVGDLQFGLYNRPAHPELFRIDHRQDVKERMYWASVWLIEGGHVVTFCWQKQFMVEILAGANGLGPRNGVLQKFPLRGERTCRQSCEEGLGYVMAGQVERMSKKVFASVYQDVLTRAQSRGTLVLHGRTNTTESLFAYVEIEARERELHVNTCHAFPEELAMAKTQSIFRAPSKPRRVRKTSNKADRRRSPK